jgi:MFS family permease
MQQKNKLDLSPSREKWVIYIIMAMYPLVGMEVDLIAPSLPAMSHQLHIASATSQNLIAIYLLGYALGNFFIGFLSDALGRRKIIIGGFTVFVFASLCLP